VSWGEGLWVADDDDPDALPPIIPPYVIFRSDVVDLGSSIQTDNGGAAVIYGMAMAAAVGGVWKVSHSGTVLWQSNGKYDRWAPLKELLREMGVEVKADVGAALKTIWSKEVLFQAMPVLRFEMGPGS
jgi:hypothetical protein